MPIKKADGTYITEIKAPNHTYSFYDWVTMTKSEIQQAVNNDLLTTEEIEYAVIYGNSLTYIHYISNSDYIRVVTSTQTELKIQQWRFIETRDEIMTVKKANGELIYGKVLFEKTHSWSPSLGGWDVIQTLYIKTPLPYDVHIWMTNCVNNHAAWNSDDVVVSKGVYGPCTFSVYFPGVVFNWHTHTTIKIINTDYEPYCSRHGNDIEWTDGTGEFFWT